MGVPAARGHGVMEVQSFEAAAGALVAAQYPEHESILRAEDYTVDRTQDSFSASTKVPPPFVPSSPAPTEASPV